MEAEPARVPGAPAPARRLARRVPDVLRDEGLRGLWWRGLAVTVYRRLLVFSRDITGPPGGAAKLEPSFELLDQAGIPEYLTFRPDQPAGEVARRLAARQWCVLARHEGELVSIRWLSTERAEMHYLDLAFELPAGVAYVFDVFTAPEARRMRIATPIRRFYEGLLRDEGCHTLLTTSLPENVAGRRLIGAAGFRTVGTVGCVRLGPLRRAVRRLPDGHLGPATRLRGPRNHT
jgi:GNAT superfamily N-acetyltransferase